MYIIQSDFESDWKYPHEYNQSDFKSDWIYTYGYNQSDFKSDRIHSYEYNQFDFKSDWIILISEYSILLEVRLNFIRKCIFNLTCSQIDFICRICLILL